EEVAREALAIDICKRFSILEEERHVIETMAFIDKYKKILDGIIMDKIKLDGEIKKEEEEAIKKVKREALKDKEDLEYNTPCFRVIDDVNKSFMRLTKGISNFRNGVITIHLELDPFLDNSKETKKFKDDWDHLLDIDFGDILEINKPGPSLSNGKPLTQEEV
nr:hypothetical protein [Tanacetum cinerariifolium]